jgi:uncharacterized protein (UPF0332 family)
VVSFADLMARARRDLETARIVVADGDPNAAANRAYYAMYHAACASLMAVGQPRLALGKTHRGVMSAFAEHVVRAGHVPAEASGVIAEVANQRILADYIGDGVTEQMARLLIDNADTFVSNVAAFVGGPSVD